MNDSLKQWEFGDIMEIKELYNVLYRVSIFIVIFLQIRIYMVRAYLCLNHAKTLFSHLGHYIPDVELQQDDSNFILSI